MKSKARPSTFVPVAVQSGLSITVQLPNGVQLHCQSLDDGALHGLLNAAIINGSINFIQIF